MSVTLKASRLIINAYKRIGVIAGTETPSADMAQDGLDRLNAMIDSWAIQRGTLQGVSRSSYALVVNQGGPSNPYIIGTGAQFGQVRPVWIEQAKILFGSGTTASELPVYICSSSDEYGDLVQKNVTSPIPQILYYEGISSGKIFLWPVPSSASQSLVLYIPVAVTQFADYNTTSYTLMDGYQLAIETNLAMNLLPEYPRASGPDPVLMDLAAKSLAYIKRMNLDPGLLRADAALLSDGGGYGTGAPNWFVGP